MRKKVVVFVVAASLTLVAPIAHGGGDRSTYKGAFETTGTMRFILERTDGGKRVINFRWVRFPLACEGGSETSSSYLEFRQKVENRRFSAEAVDNPDNPGSRLSMEGRLVGPSKAVGTLRIRGKRVPLDGPGRDECDSGTVGWRAEKL